MLALVALYLNPEYGKILWNSKVINLGIIAIVSHQDILSLYKIIHLTELVKPILICSAYFAKVSRYSPHFIFMYLSIFELLVTW